MLFVLIDVREFLQDHKRKKIIGFGSVTPKLLKDLGMTVAVY